MSYDDYTVTIYFTNHLGRPDQLTFDVMAYDTAEAENNAFAQFSDIVDSHQGTLKYHTEIVE